MINQMQSAKTGNQSVKRQSTIKFGRDYSKATVTEIFNDMLDILRKENPSMVEAMIEEGKAKSQTEKDDEMMEEDLANDNSLESKIERKVKYYAKHL